MRSIGNPYKDKGKVRAYLKREREEGEKERKKERKKKCIVFSSICVETVKSEICL